MASDPTELARAVCAAWERGDYDWVEWEDVDGPAAGTWRGTAGITEGWGRFLSAWDDFSAEFTGFRDLGDGRVLVFTHPRGRGKASGIDIREMYAQTGVTVFHVAGDKVTRIAVYFDTERALAELDV
jgi:ketosteroid isomerase-like protein